METRSYTNWRNGHNFAKGVDPNGEVRADSYVSTNMQVYSNGSLGVRPWVRNWASTGITTSKGFTDFKGMIWQPDSSAAQSNPDGYLVVSGQLTGESTYGWRYTIQLAAPAWDTTGLTTGLLSADGVYYLPSDGGSDLVDARMSAAMITPNQVIYDAYATYDATDEAFSAISWASISPSVPSVSAAYKDRVYYWGDPSDPQRIWYSDAAAPTTITSSTQFFDLSLHDGAMSYYGVLGGHALQDALVFYTLNNKWFSLTGANAVTGSLREIGHGPIPSFALGVATYRNHLWFLGGRGDSPITGLQMASPQGVDSSTYKHIQPAFELDKTGPARVSKSATVNPLRALASDDTDCLILPYLQTTTGRGIHSIDFINNGWAHSSYWSTGLSTDDVEASVTVGFKDVALAYGRAMFMLVDESSWSGGPESTSWVQLYSREITLDRPSSSTDVFSSASEYINADASESHIAAGHVRLAGFSPDAGSEVRVRQVTVDFHWWNGGSYIDPAFVVKATTKGGTSTEAVDSSETLGTYDGSALSGTKEIGRVTYNGGDLPYGSTAYVELTGIQSIAIQKITVHYEVRPNSPRN